MPLLYEIEGTVCKFTISGYIYINYQMPLLHVIEDTVCASPLLVATRSPLLHLQQFVLVAAVSLDCPLGAAGSAGNSPFWRNYQKVQLYLNIYKVTGAPGLERTCHKSQEKLDEFYINATAK